MILQALVQYYERSKEHLAPIGFEEKEIPFVLEISNEGRLIQIEDTREGEGKRKRSRSFLVPHGVKKTSGVVANLLWDNAEYVLGADTRDKPDRVADQHTAFKARIEHLPEHAQKDEGIQAIIKFYSALDIKSLTDLPLWQDIIDSNPNMAFRLQGEQALICQRPALIEAVKGMATTDADAQDLCLVSGEFDVVSRVHTAIKGVWGAQSSGANIVSFNHDAFTSYGKEQGENAPVGERAAFAYTTALNHLLRKDSPQRIQVGDASTVFWAAEPTEMEEAVPNIFGEPPKDDPDRHTRAVQTLFKSVHNGRYEADDSGVRFYVLGLAPNAGRISVRFWHVGTVAEMAERIVQHFDDVSVVHGAREPEYLSLFRLLVHTATLGKSENIPPNLAGEMMRAILEGRPYPQTLLASVIRRIRAEQEVTYPRAALIKACLNRAMRHQATEKEEIAVSLDKNNTNTGYRMGRLFAVLEKVQEEASPGINATIRDRYYGAASSTPVSVFATLVKLSKHHLAKLNKGRAINLERLLGTIIDGIDDFPPHLPLADQGRFAIGYYHQRQSLFTKSESQGEES